MNIIECDRDCKICGPDSYLVPETIYANAPQVEGNDGPFVAGGNLDEKGWVVIDLNDKNITDIKSLNLPNSRWAKIFNTDYLLRPRPGNRWQSSLAAVEGFASVGKLPEIITRVQNEAIPLLQFLTKCESIKIKDPALLRTDFDTDDQVSCERIVRLCPIQSITAELTVCFLAIIIFPPPLPCLFQDIHRDWPRLLLYILQESSMK